MTRLLALYPRSWRDRYEDEFLSLIEDRPPDALDRIDIVRGAIDARLHPRRDLGREPGHDDPLPYNGPWSVRRAGILTLIGGFLWLATIYIASIGPVVHDGTMTYRDGSAAMPTFLLSLVLLLAGVWAVAATVPSTSRVARTAALIGGFAGLLWAFAPWVLLAGLTFCLGVAILAIEAARTGRWRISDVALLVASVAAALASAVVALVTPGEPLDDAPLIAASLALLSSMWFSTAHALLRPARAIGGRTGPSRSA
jgi:hypothetical protein